MGTGWRMFAAFVYRRDSFPSSLPPHSLTRFSDHNGGKLYIPVSSAETRNLHRMHSPPPKPRIEPMDDELMQVEDTPHRVFIYDLDKELADIESDEENPIFLADIEKHMNKIPRHILVDEKSLKPTDTNQLVLYNVPASITVPEEQDNVRKAIVEARARIRQQQAFNCNNFGSGDARIRPAEDNAMMDTQGLSNGVPPSSSAGLGMKRSMQDDPDAMEIEEEL
jgi:hypothetical protein